MKALIALFPFLLLFSINSLAQQDDSSDAETSTSVEAAQEEAKQEVETVPAPPSNDRIEKLQVTGSLIRRSDVEGPSPIVTIDRQQIEASGFNNVGQLLRASTASPFGGSSTSVNLRGIGSARTLVLMNGQRLPQSGSSFSTGATNPSFVPLAAVERVEILKDGASATYGSDALGGVVNIITRKDIDGLAFATKYDYTDHPGDDTLITSLAYGKSTSKANLMTSLQHITRSHFVRSARKNEQRVNDDFFFSPNYIDDSGNISPSPNCERVDPETGQCQVLRAYDQVFTPAHEFTWATDFTYKLSADTEFYGTVLAQHLRSENLFPAGIYATPGANGNIGIALSAGETPASWDSLLPNYTGGDTQVFGVIPELGNNRDKDTQNVGGLVLGAKGYVKNTDWQWDVTLNNQISQENSISENSALYAPFRQHLIDGTYNPWDDGTNRDVSGVAINPETSSRFVVNWFESKVNGNITDNLAGAFGLAVAHTAYKDERDDRIVNQEVMALTGSEGRGSRELYALFGEVVFTPLSNFETQLSVRNDNYSDFGSTVNPKLAIKYQPLSWWMLRGSAGTGFQAPLLQDAYGPSLNAFTRQVDRFQCRTVGNNDENHPTCRTRSFNALLGGNPNLQEETSFNYNLGTVLSPLQRLNISFDYWYVKVEDTIGVDIDGLLRVEDLNNGSVPSQYTAQIVRDPVTGNIQSITAFNENIGSEEAHGIDVEVNYTFKTKVGDIFLGTEHTYLFHYWESFYDELGRDNTLGEFDKPTWRNNTTVRWSLGDFSFQIVARSTAKVQRRVETTGYIPAFTQYDATADYKAPWGGVFQIGAINVLDQRPEEDETQTVLLNTALFQAFRTSFLSYRQDF